MFTLLPSIYLMGIDFYRQWKASTHRDDEHSENILQTINRRNPPTSIPCREVNENRLTNGNHSHHESNPRVRSRKKKCTSVFKIERRKTFTDELLDDDVTFLMKKTEFTREQIVVWHGDFLVSPIGLCISTDFSVSLKSDCPEGKLSKTKFIEIYQQFYKKGRVTKFCEQAFRVFDRDHSGYMGTNQSPSLARWRHPFLSLDFVEFLLAVNLTSSNDPEQKIELFFAMYDLDSNGRIDEHEMHCFLEVSLSLSLSTRWWCFYSVHLVDLWFDGHWYKWSIAHR